MNLKALKKILAGDFSKKLFWNFIKNRIRTPSVESPPLKNSRSLFLYFPSLNVNKTNFFLRKISKKLMINFILQCSTQSHFFFWIKNENIALTLLNEHFAVKRALLEIFSFLSLWTMPKRSLWIDLLVVRYLYNDLQFHSTWITGLLKI